MGSVTSGAQSRQSHYPEQHVATSADACTAAQGARGHSPGVRAHIDAGRAFLAMSVRGGTNTHTQMLSR